MAKTRRQGSMRHNGQLHCCKQCGYDLRQPKERREAPYCRRVDCSKAGHPQ